MVCILGIETSCDETAASVVTKEADSCGIICSNIILSQLEQHSAFGGVVPEIAARAHIETIDTVIKSALEKAKIHISDLDYIAATAGPGLVGGLIVGLTAAKAIAAATEKPLFAINHLEGHALIARMTNTIEFPYLLLLVSGGHTQILFVCGVGNYKKQGSTLDDALGEAFDKVARMLHLPSPGGPNVERYALEGDPSRFAFPRPMKGSPTPDFSFSGLKTSVWRTIETLESRTKKDTADLCASFQQAVSDVLYDRVKRSMKNFLQRYPKIKNPSFVISGGVAANKHIRSILENLCSCEGFGFFAAAQELCTDNGAMIAWAALERLEAGLFPQEESIHCAPRARWPLDSIALPEPVSTEKGKKHDLL